MKRINSTLFYFLACVSLMAQQPNYFFDRITIEDGLSQGTITSIAQDSTGFMWFGTYDGLNRYDGLKFKIFKNDVYDSTTLSHNSVNQVYVDRRGNLWIATMAGGLNLYLNDKEQFRHYEHDPQDSTSISHDITRIMYEDTHGNFWVGTWGGGLNLMDREQEKFKHFLPDSTDENSLVGSRINDIHEDKAGNIWIATSSGISKYDKKNNRFYNYKHDPHNRNSLSSNDITSIFIDYEENVWAGTWNNGLNKFNLKTGKITRYVYDPGDKSSIGNDIIRDIYQDDTGLIYIATWGGGLNYYNREENNFTRIVNDVTNPKSISGNFVYTIFQDVTNILWVGTDFKGINKFDRSKQKFIHFKLGYLSTNSVTSLYQEPSGTLWLGTSGSGLNSITQDHTMLQYVNEINNKNSLSTNTVKYIVDDGDFIWVATSYGLNRFNKKTKQFKVYLPNPNDPYSISLHNIWYLMIDKSGTLWIGTYSGGLDKYDRENDRFLNYRNDPDNPNSLSNDYIWTIFEGQDGYLWIGTDDGGVNKFDPVKEQFTHYKHDPENPNSLSDNKVLSIYQDSKGIFWFGTTGGLNRFDPRTGKFTIYNVQNGLPSNSIQSLLEDGRGNLWIATNNGLTRFDSEKAWFQNFNESNGLQSNEFNVNAAFKSQTGWMYFGGINGFNVFHPDSIKINPHIPNVVITDFKLFNQEIPIGEANNSEKYYLEKSITVTKKISLTYKQNVFSFEFAGLDYSFPRNNQYAYMMEGFDKDWTYIGNRNFVTYTNLPSGNDYIFKVKATNNDGVWNEKGRSLVISISSPFYETWWFLIIAVLTTSYLIFVLYKYRTREIEERNKKLAKEISRRQTAEEQVKFQNTILEKAVQDKTQEMKILMEKMIRQERLATIGQVSASIAHELRNPLGAVKQSAYYIKSRLAGQSEKLDRHLSLIDKELAIANRVINDLLEIAHVKKTTKEVIDLEPVFDEAIKLAKIKNGVKIDININKDAKFIMADPIQIRQVFLNLLTNANQAIDVKGKIKMSSCISKDGRFFVINVADTGKGIKKEEKSKIFEPLYTTKAKGTGLGLSICRQIIDKHNGKIEIESHPGNTEVKLLIPLNDSNGEQH